MEKGMKRILLCRARQRTSPPTPEVTGAGGLIGFQIEKPRYGLPAGTCRGRCVLTTTLAAATGTATAAKPAGATTAALTA
jgi:hypothetical protein